MTRADRTRTIAEMRASGMTIKAIAKAVGLSHGGVAHYLRLAIDGGFLDAPDSHDCAIAERERAIIADMEAQARLYEVHRRPDAVASLAEHPGARSWADRRPFRLPCEVTL